MINMLCMIFSETCPVYSKPAGQPQVQQPPRPSYPGYPPSNGGPGYPTQNHVRMPQPSYPGQMPPVYSQGGPSYNNYPSPYTSTAGYPTHQQQHQTTTTPPPRPQPPTAAKRQDSVIGNDTLRMSLLSTANDKVKRRVKEVFQMGQVLTYEKMSFFIRFLISFFYISSADCFQTIKRLILQKCIYFFCFRTNYNCLKQKRVIWKMEIDR